MRGSVVALVAATFLAACSGSAPSPATAPPSSTGRATNGPASASPDLATTAPTANALAAPGRIVFGRQAGEIWQILVIGTDGTGEKPLFKELHDVTRVSHDGGRIATVSFGATSVFPTIFDADGTNPRELRPDETLSLGAMAWSRDDKWLAFEAWDDEDHSRDGIWLVRADGSDLKRLTDPGIPGDFSLDDKQLVFTRDPGGTFVIDLDGSNERRVSDMAGPYPGYLPNGSLYSASKGALWKLDPETGAATRIPTAGGVPIEPRLSPDGKWFAFSFVPEDEDSIGIWTMSVDGSNLRRIVNAAGTEEVFPDWLP